MVWFYNVVQGACGDNKELSNKKLKEIASMEDQVKKLLAFALGVDCKAVVLTKIHNLYGDEKVEFEDKFTHCFAVAESKFLKDLKTAKMMGPSNNQDVPVDHNSVNQDALLLMALKVLTARCPLTGIMFWKWKADLCNRSTKKQRKQPTKATFDPLMDIEINNFPPSLHATKQCTQ